jgi:hypothetical protein
MSDTKSINLKLFLLSRNDTPMPDEWSKCVVAASSESGARELANNESRAEGYIWNDGQLVEAEVLSDTASEGISGVVLFSRERDT